jgi:LuxR family maltose regulon positive regulatory protein
VGAFEALDRALSLAAPEGYIRVFVDEGTPMAALVAQSALRRAQNDPIRAYAERLLSAFPAEQRGETASNSGMTPVLGSALERLTVLVEPLTERELDVLRHIALGQSNTEIAQALIVAVSTVKTHINRIFGKLGATSRIQAVARARELHLL